MQGAPRIGVETTSIGVRYNLIKVLPNGNRFERHSECIVPNAFVIPDIRETRRTSKRRERGSELSWAAPVDNEHVTGLSIVAWPLEDGAPKQDWRPSTDTVQDIRPGSVLTRKYEDRQRKPDDLEAQEGASVRLPCMPSKTLERRTPGSRCCGICFASRSSGWRTASTR